MDKTGFQLNNEAGPVTAPKETYDAYSIISSEKAENMTSIACCSVEGRFLPPVLIFKGVRGKIKLGHGLQL